MKKITALVLIALLACPAVLLAAERSFKITTYYPAPYGMYKNLNAQGADTSNTKVALQASGSAGTGMVVTNANRVGIGTSSPTTTLEVTGGTVQANDGVVAAKRLNIPQYAAGTSPTSPQNGDIWIQN